MFENKKLNKYCFILLALSLISCNSDLLKDFEEAIPEDEDDNGFDCQRDSLVLEGIWHLQSYSEIINDNERVYYQNSVPQQSNYYPNEISGEMIFENDNYRLDINLVFIRSVDSLELVNKVSSGVHWADSACGNDRCIAYLTFFNLQQDVFTTDSISKVCHTEINAPMLHWTNVESDSLLLHWIKQ